MSGASAVILFFQEILWHFSKIDEEDRRFRLHLLFYQKKILRQNHPLGDLSPYYATLQVQKSFKNSSTAPILIIFIYKRPQVILIHGLSLQLCRKWPLFAVKKTYVGVYVAIFFKGFSSKRVKKIWPALPR